jgi:hypothetical protein
MTDLTKQAIRCSQCELFRKHTEYTAPVDFDSDPTKPVCDHCVAAKAMDIPCMVYRSDGSEPELTTVAKAVGLDRQQQLADVGERIADLKNR